GGATAMDMDVPHRRLFIGGRNKVLAIMDADNGKVLQTFPIGDGVDTNIYEPEKGLLFTATREGTLHIFHEDAPDKFSVVETVKTEFGARNIALDPKTHRLFIDTADFPPASAPTAVQDSQSNSERAAAGGQPQSPLSYAEYRTHIEPIFLKRREGGVRCYDCHSTLTTRLRLQAFLPGDSSWTEEQSRKNFESVSQLVKPRDPLGSRLLLHPLAQEAGGDPAHSGGKFWKSQQDPEWQVLAAWVRGNSSVTPSLQPATPATDTLSFPV